MSNKAPSLLDALKTEKRAQDDELASLCKRLNQLPADIEFAIAEDALERATDVVLALPTNPAHIRA